METAVALDDLVVHLEHRSGLDRRQIVGLIEDVTAYFSESVEEFVTRRHGELQRDDLRNPQIFERIVREIHARRFAAAPLTARQVRRLVYG